MPFSQFSNAPNLGQRMATTAITLLSLYGDTNVTFQRIIPGTFDPTTGQTSGSITLYYTSQGISSNFTEAELASSTVQYGDMKYIIYPPIDGSVPQVGDTVQLNNITYRVMNVINQNLQGVVMVFELQLRV